MYQSMVRNIGVFIEQRGGPGGTRGGHNPSGRAWVSWRALVGCSPLGAPPPLGAAQAHWVPSGLEKISKKLCCVWTPFDIDFLRCKKQAKNNNWHWALGQ